MSKNRVILIVFLFAVFLLPLVNAETNSTEDKVAKAYQCLKNEVANKTSTTLSLQESIFTILALGNQKKAVDKIESEKSPSSCWPKESCRLKETAQVALAYKKIGKDTRAIETYLVSRNASATGLDWFLMIDITNRVPSTCTIKYGGSSYAFSIGEDMKISGSGGACLTIIPSGYWLKIASSCTNNQYEISCNDDFITTLVYQKTGSDTIFISPETHSAAGQGTTQEQISSKCFRTGESCDYEGSLWTTLALQQTNHDVSQFIPFLVALAPDNENVFPSSFLYKLTTSQDQYSSIVQSQIQGKYWQAPATPYNKFYDTALALVALKSTSSAEAESAKSYLLNSGLQTPQGCWNNNNIRDTAFLLYAGWSETSSGSSSSGNDSSSGGLLGCQAPTGYCVTGRFACTESGGNLLDAYECSVYGDYCCSISVQQQTCSEQNGRLCSSNQVCSDKEVNSAEGTCCLGTCNQAPPAEANVCEDKGGFCASSCTSTETQTADACLESSQVCCMSKDSSGGSSSGGSKLTLWIILLSALILLAVLAIVFRNKLQLMLFKWRKGGVSSSPVVVRRPPFPPLPPPGFPRQQSYRPASSPSPRRAQSSSDKDMEDTLRKLRDMAK